MRRIVLILLVVANLTTTAPAQAAPAFLSIEGFATKSGFRGVVAWQASAPISPVVHWGTSPFSMPNEVVPAGRLDTAGLAILDDLPVGSTIHYRVVDTLTGTASATSSFAAANAHTNYADGVYTINVLVSLESPGAPDGVPHDVGVTDIAAGINILAERVYDALDGHARLGKVLVTDTVPSVVDLSGKAGRLCTPFSTSFGTYMGTRADVVYYSSPPVDSRTAWEPPALPIDNSCWGVYMGRLGALTNFAWLDDLYLGWLTTHEFIHYAFGTDDRYAEATDLAPVDCDNPAYDISIMDNSGGYKSRAANQGTDGPWVTKPRWYHTELDRAEVATCPAGVRGQPSWPRVRENYPQVPDSNVPENIVDVAPRGNPDGGALEILLLRNTPAGSSLTRFEPTDAPSRAPVVGSFTPEGSLPLSFVAERARATPATSPEGCTIEVVAPEGRLAPNHDDPVCHSAQWGYATTYRDPDVGPVWPASFTSAPLPSGTVLGGEATLVVHNADVTRAIVGGPAELEIVVEELAPDGVQVVASTTVGVGGGRTEATFDVEPWVVEAGSQLRVRMRLASQTASAARMLFGGMYGDAGITLTTGRVA